MECGPIYALQISEEKVIRNVINSNHKTSDAADAARLLQVAAMGSNSYQHWQALLSACASSTDNFVVGVSLGLHEIHDVWILIWGIAACNAAGCLLSSVFGNSLMSFSTHNFASIAAGTAFAYLAYQEIANITNTPLSNHANSNSSAVTQTPPIPRFHLWELALPMTLNNLAGGVATGVAGVNPLWAAFYALIISALFMYVGQRLGLLFMRKGQSSSNPSLTYFTTFGSVFLYGILSLQSFYNASLSE
jgi:putative Mn2+ efflux pump MntP